MNLFGETTEKGAELSECGKYRYKLWRLWDFTKPYCLFIMHNPSTADADQDDPTIRRCIAFAKSWGYGGIYVGKLIPYRATNPKDLLKVDKVTYNKFYENRDHVKQMAEICEMHIMAYGNSILRITPDHLFSLSENWHYLSLTKSGKPGHPLYLKSDLKPISFSSEILK